MSKLIGTLCENLITKNSNQASAITGDESLTSLLRNVSSFAELFLMRLFSVMHTEVVDW